MFVYILYIYVFCIIDIDSSMESTWRWWGSNKMSLRVLRWIPSGLRRLTRALDGLREFLSPLVNVNLPTLKSTLFFISYPVVSEYSIPETGLTLKLILEIYDALFFIFRLRCLNCGNRICYGF